MDRYGAGFWTDALERCLEMEAVESVVMPGPVTRCNTEAVSDADHVMLLRNGMMSSQERSLLMIWTPALMLQRTESLSGAGHRHTVEY